jgi:hypothetical protein
MATEFVFITFVGNRNSHRNVVFVYVRVSGKVGFMVQTYLQEDIRYMIQ